MVDLSTLDENTPRDTESVSLGDDAIRQTRAAMKTTLALEHDLETGVHRIPTGPSGSRPPAGKQGRLFLNTTTQKLEYDTGSEWKVSAPASSRLINVQPPINEMGQISVYSENFANPVTALLFGSLSMWAPGGVVAGTAMVLEVARPPLASAWFVGHVYMIAPVIVVCTGIGSINLWLSIDRSNTGRDVSVRLQASLLVI
jgi:hypothetical protein